MAISYESLEQSASKLWVYDVLQQAWEQEPNGFEANAHHVLTHLTRTLWNKDFKDEVTVKTEIAPDSLQFALRLIRWGELPPHRLFAMNDPFGVIERATEQKNLDVPVHQVAFLQGTAILAEHLHALGHSSEREEAIKTRQSSVIGSGAVLMASAQYQAEEFGFDLIEAFDDRLAALRERFNIPDPAADIT